MTISMELRQVIIYLITKGVQFRAYSEIARELNKWRTIFERAFEIVCIYWSISYLIHGPRLGFDQINVHTRTVNLD